MVTKKTQSRKSTRKPVAKSTTKAPVIKQVINKKVDKVAPSAPVAKVEYIPPKADIADKSVDTKVDIVEKPVDIKKDDMKKAMNAPKLPKEVGFLNTILDEYVTLSNTYPTHAVLEKKIKSFARMLLYVINHPTPSVLNRLFTFFTVERNRVMSEYNAMGMISKLKYIDRERYSAFYTVFIALIDLKTKGRPFKFNLNAVAHALKSSELMNFIAVKLEE